jgi:hypothetical protein
MRKDLKNIIKRHCIKNKDIIKLSYTLQELNFSILAIGDGLINKEDFLPPCIILAPISMPKIRLNREIESLKKYFTMYNKKRIEDFTAKEYLDYLDFAERAGETKEYRGWRVSSEKTISDLIQKVKKFNSLNKSKFKLSVLKFDEGTLRLDFADQKKDEIRHKYNKVTMNKKRAIMSALFLQFSLFNIFLNKSL